MKRSYLGFGLLLVLLVLSIGATIAMTRLHDPLEGDLNQAAEAVLQGDWAGGEDYFYRARDVWEEDAHFRACLADHTPVEEIDAEFALLEVYCQTREDAAFAASCRELARKVAAVGEAHELVWWNLF